jgi:type I restriction enzyme, S subunit
MIGFAACSKPQFSGNGTNIALGELCEILNGYAFKSKRYVDEGIRVIRIANVQKGYLEDSHPCFYPATEKGSIAQFLLYENDLLLSLTGNVGRVALLDNKFLPAALNQRVACLRVKDGSLLNKRYLFHCLNSMCFENRCIASANGIAQKNLSTVWLRGYAIPVPQMDKQLEIARRFDLIQAQIGRAKAQMVRLDALVKSRFVEMFGDPNLIQQSETWERIGNLCEVVGGATPKTSVDEYWNGGLPWITPAEIKEGDKFLYDTQRKLSEAGVRSTSMSRMPIGTVILSSRAPIGKVAIAGIEMYCNQGFKNLICGPEVLPGYLYELLRANSEYLNSLGRGATFKELSKKTVDNIKIPVPALERQGEFVDFASKVDKLRFRCLETLRLYLATVHFVAQQIVVMAGLFWGQRNIKPRCFNATWIRMEDGQHG